MITLTKEQIIRLHKKLLDATGGIDGIRDESLLDSSLSAAFQTFDGAPLNPLIPAVNFFFHENFLQRIFLL